MDSNISVIDPRFLSDDLSRRRMFLAEDSSRSEFNSDFCIMCEGENVRGDNSEGLNIDDVGSKYQQCVSCYGFCHQECNPPTIQACYKFLLKHFYFIYFYFYFYFNFNYEFHFFQ